MIRLSGFEPDEDIEVKYTGLRPGEKLYEELLMKEEGMRSTPNKLIYIGQPLNIDEAAFVAQLDELEKA
jgi:FlaA1/EpsC-like NDP-sugar epimerase